MGNSLLESANKLMGKSSYEQAEMEADAKKLDEMMGGEEENGLDVTVVGLADKEGEEGIEDEMEAEEVSAEIALKAIQLALDGLVEDAEEALEKAKAAAEEVEGGEEGEEAEVAEESTDEGEGEEDVIESEEEDAEEVSEESEEVAEEAEEVAEETEEVAEEAEEDAYGESHSMFLKFADRYL